MTATQRRAQKRRATAGTQALAKYRVDQAALKQQAEKLAARRVVYTAEIAVPIGEAADIADFLKDLNGSTTVRIVNVAVRD